MIVTIQTPTNLSGRQKELLQELGTSLGTETVASEEKGFLERIREALGL